MEKKYQSQSEKGGRPTMKLTNLEIKNFRGIKYSSVSFPLDSRIICLIGAGDSGKSTLLTAIEWALWPSWSLVATDTDFYNSDTTTSIEINVSITELPKALIKEDKFGLYLRDFNKVCSGRDDEPTDKGISIITIQLTIDESLEPKWNVITNRTDPKPISQKDRRLLSFGVVGFEHEKDFQWGRGSILQKYADSRDVLHNAFTQAMRVAVENTRLEALDQMGPKLIDVGKQYGVGFNGEIHNRILMQNGSYSTIVGVFEDKVPFAQRGLGSKRLLSIGMNVNAYEDGTLVLVDEVETGLEPYRISALINQFRSQFKDQGQLIMTTHSRSVVCECGVNELCVANNKAGELTIHWLDGIEDIKGEVQGMIRGEPDAFLCKRIIVCEGKTEIGLLRSLDENLFRKTGIRFAHYGVGTALGGGGNKFFSLARLLKSCGFDCCILMDSDIENEEREKEKVEKLGIKVFSWEKGNAIEEQLFKDATIQCAEQLLAYAVEIKGIQSVEAHLNNEFRDETKEYRVEDGAIILCGNDNGEVRIDVLRRIGKVAKGKYNKKENKVEGAWFKRIDRGQDVGDIVFSSEDQLDEESNFKKNINDIIKWVTGCES